MSTVDCNFTDLYYPVNYWVPYYWPFAAAAVIDVDLSDSIVTSVILLDAIADTSVMLLDSAVTTESLSDSSRA